MLDMSIIINHYHKTMSSELNFFFSLAKTNALISRVLFCQGLDFSDFIILYHLSAAPEQKLRRIDLAKKMGLTPSGVTRMLLPLEKLGIIKRDLDDNDARARFAAITQAGKVLLSDAQAHLEFKMKDLLPSDKNNILNNSTQLLNTVCEKAA